MGNADQPAAGQGKLAELLATRGGLASPEAPFVIEHREALIYMLCEAAELEHGIMCQYLFAAFSLKQSAAEGLTNEQVSVVTRWRRQVSHVAAQEMLHLALVHNLLSAIGSAPHLGRPNLPQPAGHYPAGVQLALLPFGEQALRHFMFLERPEGMDLADADGLAACSRAAPLMSERDIVPRPQDFATVGHLYRSIEAGIAGLAARHGEDWLFVGPPRAQATPDHFRWPELVAVTDLTSAQRAIDTILEQGEGPRGNWRNAHFGQFVAILDEYEQLTAADPAFEPVRPVIAANVRQPERDADVPLIGDPLTCRVTDLFNVAYEILLQIFERYFAHTEESDAQLKVLADATLSLMLEVIRPLGGLITTLPVGPGQPGRNAGPSFELFYETDYLMPHREAAWALLAERLGEAAWLGQELMAGRGAALAGDLTPVVAALRDIRLSLAAQLPAASVQARQARQPAALPAAEVTALLARAAGLARSVAATPPGGAAQAGLADLLGQSYALLTAAAADPEAAAVLPRLTDRVLRPLADALNPPGARTGRAAPSGPVAPAGTGPAGAGPAGAASELAWQAAQAATVLHVRLRAGGPAAAGPVIAALAEATAALQALGCDLAPEAERAGRRAALSRLQAELPAEIRVAPDGPYLVTNVPGLVNDLGEPIRATPQLALCRCGASAAKPFCDGSHARTGFTGAKDPKRVPDRRDAYPGQEVTVRDNRGLCQHSGFCTDRLPAVFRTATEPFVAPSGGRLDEIIRAVRSCPSGALGLVIEGREALEVTGWGGRRTPAIEVTRDGPYRITGTIAVVDADGRAVPRNDGASAEHAALCRCGHSQNKPFCSGMHWYVGFRDPVPPAGYEPTLFEWAGGLPGLTRMTRLLYSKHVPADPLLAALFATMPPEHADREARWLAEVFGGPAGYTADRGGPARAAAAHAGLAITPEQQARWTDLALLAAREAGLPADAEFTAALRGYFEWGSRTAARESQPGAPPATTAPLPRWGWTAAGPPDTAPAAPAAGEVPVSLPGPDEAVSFAAHIKPMFRESDRTSMSFAFDLWSADAVRTHAAGILARLRDGSMPCDGAWPDAQIEVFRRWTESGRPA